MFLLRPIRLAPREYQPLEEAIKRFLNKEFFAPLAASVGANLRELTNAFDPLIDALEQGRVYYDDGKFRGEFNSHTSKRLREIGAKYDILGQAWKLERGKVPPHVLSAAARADSDFTKIKDSLVVALDRLDIDQAFQKYGFTDEYERYISRVNDNFEETVSAVAIAPKFTADQKRILAEQWSQNLKLWIQKWSAQSILDLRQDVQENAFAGRRAENLVKMISGEYGVSKRKAKFLAHQETSLLMSKIRETRYKDVGISEYLWSGRDDGRERPEHVRLNETRHRFDKPPLVTYHYKTKTVSRRVNPGEDFGCRCTARPIFSERAGP